MSKRIILFLLIISLLLVGCEEMERNVKVNRMMEDLPRCKDVDEGYCKITKGEYNNLVSGIGSIDDFYNSLKSSWDIFDIKTSKASTITMCNKGCHHKMYCGSNSMSPVFSCNDKLWGYKPSSNEIGVGDIIFSKNPSGNLIHRVIGFTEDGKYITKGDNNNFIDEYNPSYQDIFIKIGRIDYR